MTKEIENPNSPNEEQPVLEETDDTDALKQQKQELSDRNRQLFERAKKAESAEKELKEKLKGLSEAPKPKEEAPVSQPNETNLARKAYLNSLQITHQEDQKVILDEAARLKLDVDEVVDMEHVKARIQTQKDAREAQAGLPPRGRGTGGGGTPHDVEYHLAKGTTPDDQALAEKVVAARMGKEAGNKFSDELYVG